MNVPSVRVGSASLGWREIGDVAELGHMTRAMPGGDGSLELSLPGKAAGERRNVLQDGALVVLSTGDDTWAGQIVGDPLAGYYAAQPSVAVAAAGPWAIAARRRDLSWTWVDSDPTKWRRITQTDGATDADGLTDLPDQGKFTVDTNGRLYLRADADRTFAGYARSALAYWLDDGLVDAGCRIVGLDIEYQTNLPNTPSNWTLRALGYVGSPWTCARVGATELNEGANRAPWHTENIDLSAPATSLVLRLGTGSSGGSPATDPLAHIKTVSVRCRMSGGSVDRSVTIDKAMCDLATLTGLATVTRSETLGAARDDLVLRAGEERGAADGLRELAAMHAGDVEHYFDYAAGATRFTVNAVPAAVNPLRNRAWVVDDRRPGESAAGVARDPEAAPAFVRVYYLSSGVTGLPDGTPRSTCYPTEPAGYAENVQTFTDYAGAKLADSDAAAIAARVHSQRNRASFAGSFVMPATALTLAGQELPSRLVRPGDRVTIVGRDGAANLYVNDTSYDWQGAKMTANAGWPFDLVARPYVPTWSWSGGHAGAMYGHGPGGSGLGSGGHHPAPRIRYR